MRKCVVYCLTSNYYQYLIPSLKSLLANTHIDTVYVLAEDDHLPFEVPECVKVINVSGQKYFKHDGPNYHCAWSYMVLMRGALAKIIQEDQVLSLDADTIIYEDISPLWDYDLTGYYMAGAREVRLSEIHPPIYTNFGVTMLNLKELRDVGTNGRCKTDELIWWMNNVTVQYCEQDTHNKLCAGHILELPSDYNATRYEWVTRPTNHVVIKHYAGVPTWEWYGYPEVKEWRNRPWVVK